MGELICILILLLGAIIQGAITFIGPIIAVHNEMMEDCDE